MGTYARRSPLRFLAPVALIAFGLALIVVLSSSDSGGNGNTESASERQKDQDLGGSTKTTKKRKAKAAAANGSLPTRSYTVQRGDTLGSISEKTGIPVDQLQELNPQIDPQQLTTGQKIKLRE